MNTNAHFYYKMSLTRSLTFTLDENQTLPGSIPILTSHQIQTLDSTVRQYSTHYITVGFKENLHKTMKWLSSHNIKIDKDDPN
jgi:hypothetical protein